MYIGSVWYERGFDSYKYEMFLDTIAHTGIRSATIKSIDKKIEGLAFLMQSCKSDKYIGKRVRMNGYVKSENVASLAGLSFRVHQAESEELLAVDDMLNRPIKGTTPWTKYVLVLDVPINATTIEFGASIYGTGQIWFDDISFEVVDNSVNTTSSNSAGNQIRVSFEPVNLDFEK